MLDPNLLVVGPQVPTAYGGFIDLLCIDRDGFLVVVELKRKRTPREVTAQALDYASWAKDLNTDDVKKIAKERANIDSLEDALAAKFGRTPERLCERHRSIIVAEAIDDSTERIVHYLSELGVPINFARMHAFKDDSSGQEMLAQVFLVEPEIARDRARSSSSLTASQRVYLRFWTEFLPMYRDAHKDAGNPTPSRDSWMGFRTGRAGFLYHAGFDGDRRLRTGVYIDTRNKETTKEVFDKLHGQKQQIEQSIGEPLEWDRLDHRQGSRISLYFNGDTDEDGWPSAMKWLVSAMGKMREAFGPVIREL